MDNKIKRRGFLKYLAAMVAVPLVFTKESSVEEKLELVLDNYQPLYLSPENLRDIRKWGVDHIDKTIRTIIIKG